MMKDITLPDKERRGISGLHIKVPGAIINIRPYLTTMEGKAVTSIEIIPDVPEPGIFPDYPERRGVNVRVYHKQTEEPEDIFCHHCGEKLLPGGQCPGLCTPTARDS